MAWAQRLPSGGVAKWNTGAAAKGEAGANGCCRCGGQVAPCRCPDGWLVAFGTITFGCVSTAGWGGTPPGAYASIDQVDAEAFCLQASSTYTNYIPCWGEYVKDECHYNLNYHDESDCSDYPLFTESGLRVAVKQEAGTVEVWGIVADAIVIFHGTVNLAENCVDAVTVTNELASGDIGTTLSVPWWAIGGDPWDSDSDLIVIGYGGSATVTPGGCGADDEPTEELTNDCPTCPENGTPSVIRVKLSGTHVDTQCKEAGPYSRYQITGGIVLDESDNIGSLGFDVPYIEECHWQGIYDGDGLIVSSAWSGGSCIGTPASTDDRIIVDIWRRDCGEWEINVTLRTEFFRIFSGKVYTPTCLASVDIDNAEEWDWAWGTFLRGMGKGGKVVLTFP